MVLDYLMACTIYHWLGLIGALIYVVSFAAVQFDRITGNGIAFPSARLTAALCVMAGLMVEFNLATFVINAAYLVISLFGVLRQAHNHMRRVPHVVTAA